MFYSKMRKEDGYYEVLASFEEQTPPLFRLRAVSTIEGSMQAVVRHSHGSGISVKFGNSYGNNELYKKHLPHEIAELAIKECKTIVNKYIKEHL